MEIKKNVDNFLPSCIIKKYGIVRKARYTLVAKYSKVLFPFFGLNKKPHLIKFDLQKILIQRNYRSHLETADDKSLAGDYFARLASLEHRVHFDVTCKNIQELVYSGPKWGMDYKAIPYD